MRANASQTMAAETTRRVPRGWLATDECDEQREAERGDVEEHVASVGQKGERVRRKRAHHLDEEKAGREAQRPLETAHAGIAMGMRVSMVSHVWPPGPRTK